MKRRPPDSTIDSYEGAGRDSLERRSLRRSAPYSLGRLQAKLPEMQRHLNKSVVHEERLKSHMQLSLERKGERLKIDQEAYIAMQIAVKRYFSNLLTELYDISRKRGVGNEMKGKIQTDVGMNVSSTQTIDIPHEGYKYAHGYSRGNTEQASRGEEERVRSRDPIWRRGSLSNGWVREDKGTPAQRANGIKEA